MGREAAPKPGDRDFSGNRVHRFCCRFAPDRGTSHPPTPSAEADRRTHRLLILAAGRRSAACSRWAAKRPQNLATEIPQGKPRAKVLLPLRARSRDKPRSYAFGRIGSAPPGRSGSAYAYAFDSGRRPWERSLLAMGCEAAPNPATEISQETACTGFAAASRQIAGQATLLRLRQKRIAASGRKRINAFRQKQIGASGQKRIGVRPGSLSLRHHPTQYTAPNTARSSSSAASLMGAGRGWVMSHRRAVSSSSSST
jgi:hypothetical protein